LQQFIFSTKETKEKSAAGQKTNKIAKSIPTFMQATDTVFFA